LSTSLKQMMERSHDISMLSAPGFFDVPEREVLESYESNLVAICSMLKAGAWKAATPHDAVEAADLGARVGMPAVQLSRVYRAGQDMLWLEFIAPAIAARAPNIEVMTRCLDIAYRMLSEFFSRVEQDVCDRLQQGLRMSSPAQRIDAVRSILTGHEPGTDVLGYPLRGLQMAIICWTPLARTSRPPAILDVATLVAGNLPRGARLVVQASARTAYVWVNLKSADQHVDAAKIDAALHRQGVPAHVAMGGVAQGIEGFRSSHAEAQEVMEYVIASSRPAPSATSYEQTAFISLLLANRDRAENFARRQLGPMADDTPAMNELRDTLRIYLESYRSQSRTARLVHVHRNTVGNRIQRAEALLGYAIAKSRPELYAALVILKEVAS
jgi:hypothetical protein